MDKVEPVVLFTCNLIDDMTVKCQTPKDVFFLADLMRSRMIMEDYAQKYNKESWETNRVEAEIQAAETYLNRWSETGLEHFREIAKDEIEHAKMILGAATSIPPWKAETFKKRIHALMEE